jgi:hypothetical protein
MLKKILLSPWTAIITLLLVLFIRQTDPAFVESIRLRYFDQLIANKAPTVSITSPLQGATVGSDIMTRIEGTATDTDGTPTSVLVSINGNTAINSTVTDGRWQVDIAPPAGTWTLIVRSVDDQGLTSESASRTLTFSYPSPSETVINPFAISINPTQAASVILEVTETTVKFVSGYTVDVGDILNIDPFTLAEDGALRKVLAITDTPSGRVVSTSQATLTDLILQIDIGGTQALNAQSTPDVQERRISAQSVKLFEAKRTLNGPDIPLKIGTRDLGAVKVSVILNLDVVGELEIGSEWCWCKDFVKFPVKQLTYYCFHFRFPFHFGVIKKMIITSDTTMIT